MTDSLRDAEHLAGPGAGPVPHYPGVVERIGFLDGHARWWSYPFAVALTLAAIGVRRWLDMFGDGIVPFALFFPVVLASTVVGGVGPGVASLALSAAATTIFWIEPRGDFGFTPTGAINIALFLVSSAAMIAVAHLLRTAYNRLRQSEARLSLSQEVGQIGIWDLDLRTDLLWWSPSHYKLTGLAAGSPPSMADFIDRIDPADRERVVTAYEVARQGHDRLDLEFRFTRGDGNMIWMAARAELFRDAQGVPTRLFGINFDATPMRTVTGERDRAHTLLRTFFDSLPGAAYVKDTEGRILLGNPGFAAAVGHPPEEFLGRTDLEFIRDAEQARAFRAHDEAVIASGVAQQLEEDLLLPDGRLSHWLSIKTPFRDGGDEVKGIVGISLDMTERRRAEQRSRVLADEVDHRARNLLGVVQAIVRLTRVEDVAAFKSVLSGRIRALARAHSLLAASRWDGVDLARLVHEELAPFERTTGEKPQIAGPSLTLGPGASQALAMVLHELATNAARHGALSAERGRLAVTWAMAERDGGDARIELTWAETGGPAVVAPVRPGFGFTTIQGAVEHQLSGAIAFDWTAAGMTCRIAFPAAGNVVQDPGAPAPAPAPETRAEGGAPSGLVADVEPSGRCVLIVDDEALIALTLAESLRDIGFTVLGPAPSVEAAMALIRRGAPDCAVLDINLAGRSSTPVARALRALEVPFVYCTGYAEPDDQIAPGLEAEVITKPADPDRLAAALGWAA